MNDSVEKLLKGDGVSETENTDVLDCSKSLMRKICESLSVPSEKYDENNTIEIIREFIDLESKNKTERILYSEFSSYLFSLNEESLGTDGESLGTFIVNVDKLIQFSVSSQEKDKIESDIKKIIVKIYDHTQLVNTQVLTIKERLKKEINEAVDEAVNEAVKETKAETKRLEREYITILGIFASIVLAFVGGLTFSTSVLQNIDSISIYRLIFVIDFIAFVLISIIYLLVKFIMKINDIEVSFDKWLRRIYRICGIIAILVIVAWVISAKEIPIWLNNHFPWGNQ